MNMNWTEPFYDGIHLEPEGQNRRATVEFGTGYADLLKWFPGCGFSPIKETHDTVEQAKAAGEAWVERGV